jgi:hypothetical protein|nr:MAG: hypothetical protein [Bacteriophage sp.]
MIFLVPSIFLWFKYRLPLYEFISFVCSIFTLPAALTISSPAYMDYLGVIVTILATPEVGIAALVIL